mmetsp:Transcript_4709/g.21466  ORF Transcript_4709/g.21466 Transcript_4709/m.21466 type:complete len:273 (-) Transcript_4709:3106-3924(-)
MIHLAVKVHPELGHRLAHRGLHVLEPSGQLSDDHVGIDAPAVGTVGTETRHPTPVAAERGREHGVHEVQRPLLGGDVAGARHARIVQRPSHAQYLHPAAQIAKRREAAVVRARSQPAEEQRRGPVSQTQGQPARQDRPRRAPHRERPAIVRVEQRGSDRLGVFRIRGANAVCSSQRSAEWNARVRPGGGGHPRARDGREREELGAPAEVRQRGVLVTPHAHGKRASRGRRLVRVNVAGRPPGARRLGGGRREGAGARNAQGPIAVAGLHRGR